MKNVLIFIYEGYPCKISKNIWLIGINDFFKKETNLTGDIIIFDIGNIEKLPEEIKDTTKERIEHIKIMFPNSKFLFLREE